MLPLAALVDGLTLCAVVRGNNWNDDNRRRNVNANYRPDNGFGMAPCLRPWHGEYTKTYTNLYESVCSKENIMLAFMKARRRKTKRNYIVEFEANLEQNLDQLKYELDSFTYSPAAPSVFIVKDPKTRKISAPAFRDRVVHHALCNIIGPILQKNFIHDSFANQIGKGTHRAIKRFEHFARKVEYSNSRGVSRERESYKKHICGHVLKADVRHYFDNIDHDILVEIVERKIKDPNVIWLIKEIIQPGKGPPDRKGLPLGNLTSQFFANVYLNDLDQFVKHRLKAKFYIRYVDDFVILHRDKMLLEKWKNEIDLFLSSNLKVELHPEKSKVSKLESGTTFLGFRIFYKHRLLKKSNSKRIWKRLEKFKKGYNANEITSSEGFVRLEGWLAYAKFADTYDLRIRVVSRFNDIVLKYP